MSFSLYLDAKRFEQAGLVRRANQRHHPVATAAQLLDDLAADEIGRTGDEIVRHVAGTADYAGNFATADNEDSESTLFSANAGHFLLESGLRHVPQALNQVID